MGPLIPKFNNDYIWPKLRNLCAESVIEREPYELNE